MNNLSILLLAADILSNLSIALIAIGVGLISIRGFVAACQVDNFPDEEGLIEIFKSCKRSVIIGALMFLVGMSIPSKETLYMIAASEMGEDVLKSETGKKAQEALNRYLDGIGKDEDESR